MPTLSLSNGLAWDLANIVRCGLLPVTAWDDDDSAELVKHGITELADNRPTGDTTRWESIHELVIKTGDGRLWHTTYCRGLTERQDTRPFEYDGDKIDFTQVERKPVDAYKYVPVA